MPANNGHAHIEFTRTGGLGGLRMTATIDTDQLPTEKAAQVTEALDRVDLASLAATGPPKGAPDRFVYDLTVTRRESKYTITVAENDVPADLRPLIELLTSVAKPQP